MSSLLKTKDKEKKTFKVEKNDILYTGDPLYITIRNILNFSLENMETRRQV